MWKKVKLSDLHAGDIVKIVNSYTEIIAVLSMVGEYLSDDLPQQFILFSVGGQQKVLFKESEIEKLFKMELTMEE